MPKEPIGIPGVEMPRISGCSVMCRFRFETETRALSVFNDLRETEV